MNLAFGALEPLTPISRCGIYVQSLAKIEQCFSVSKGMIVVPTLSTFPVHTMFELPNVSEASFAKQALA